ncbi:winged helix-turn-helix domain-containing protein [Ningiella sp. W23]|uniref:winged helix-turn-helix domain-containing protein n=1 Tax=Ningiella sp. W23 TaxID=3023715 RepID=UPI0037563F68
MEEVIINDCVRYCLKTGQLSRLDSVEQYINLDNLETAVLSYFIERDNTLITYDNLLSIWSSPVATENSLNRVISSLRKKFKQVGIAENLFINTSKKGYTFVGKLGTDDKAVPVPWKKWILSFSIVSLLVIAFNITIDWQDKVQQVPAIDMGEVRTSKLLEDADFKLDLAYNLANDRVAYSKKNIKDKYWYSEILDRYRGDRLRISLPNKNVRKNVWLTDNELVVRVYTEESCSIEKVTIDESYETFTFKTLFPCNPNSYASSLAKLDETRLLITDAKFNDTASDLYLGDTTTGEVTRIAINNDGGAGFYKVITHANSDLVALLSSSDGVTFRIDLVDSADNWKRIWTEYTKSNNYSVAWDGARLAFRNNKNGITIVTFNGTLEAQRINLPMLTPIHNISNASENSILLTSGQFAAQKLTYNDAVDSHLISNKANIHASVAVFLTDNDVLYVSTETGINQIWLYDHKARKNRQVSNFIEEQRIFNISVDEKNEFLAIEDNDGITLYRLNVYYSELEVLHTIKGRNPFFYQQTLGYADYSGQNSVIRAYDLASGADAELNIQGGLVGRTLDNKLYYSKRFQPGIWQYFHDNEDRLVLELPSSSYRWLLNDKHIVYQNDIGEYFEYNLEAGTVDSFQSETCVRPLTFKGKLCISGEPTESETSIIVLE